MSVLMKQFPYRVMCEELFQKQYDFLMIFQSLYPDLNEDSLQSLLTKFCSVKSSWTSTTQLLKMATDFKKGDLVWAKMKGYPFWPGRIANPLKEMKKPSKGLFECVYFFGTKNYSWIETKCLKDYESNKSQFETSIKSLSFKSALEDLNNSLNGDPDVDEDDDGSFDQQVGASSTPKNVKKTKTVGQSKKRKSTDESNARDSTNKKTKRKEAEDNSVTNFRKRKVDKLTNSSLTYSKNDSYQSYVSPRSYGLMKNIKKKMEIEPLDLINKFKELEQKKIQPINSTIGFIGLGIMGSRILKNILDSNHTVLIWNRAEQKCQDFEQIGAKIVRSTYDLVKQADIIFLCVENEKALLDIIFATPLTCAIESFGSKTFINLTVVSAEVSEHISDLMEAFTCKYLSVNIIGTPEDANKAELCAMVAGDKSIIEEAKSCFEAFTHKQLYMGTDFKIMNNLYTIANCFSSSVNIALMEGLSAGKKSGLSISQIMDVVNHTPLLKCAMTKRCKMYEKKGVLPEIAPVTEVLRGPIDNEISDECNRLLASLNKISYPN